ncbi:MAG: hypothetical protein ACRERC_05160 [Candidatus Binatia bacterium]
MRVAFQRIAVAVALLAVIAAPALGRTDCKTNSTAVCVDLANQVGTYDRLLWAICAADTATVCTCYDAQQREAGVDWCQWASCACSSLGDATLKTGACGLSTACSTLATLKQQNQALEKAAGPAQLAAQVAQVRDGQEVDCSPDTCMAVGSSCARAAGGLEILKNQGVVKNAAACVALAKDPQAFSKHLKVDGLSPAIAVCACAAVF